MQSIAGSVIMFFGIIFIVSPVTEYFWPGRSTFTLALGVAVFYFILDRALKYLRSRNAK